MAGYFFDTSAIVKRYVRETGTTWVRGLTRYSSPAPVYLAQATLVEVTSAIVRRSKGTPNAARVPQLLARFRQHFAGRYQTVEITQALWLAAADLVETHGLRAYDAVQLAAALHIDRQRQANGFGGITFICADQELSAAAQAEGLSVDDPNQY